MRFLVEHLRVKDIIEKSDLYKLDDTIEFMVNSLENRILNSTSTRQYIIDLYKKTLSEKFETNKCKIQHALRKNDEYYEKLFESGIGNDYYYLIWSVKSLKTIIETEKIKSKKLKTAELLPIVERSGITKDGLHRAKYHKSPIIIAEVPFLNPHYLIVDGNHRLLYKEMTGEKYIDCYILKSSHHKKAMVNELFRYIYDLNVNIGLLLHRRQY